MPSIDLNCDLGEGAGHDSELMPLVTSANLACGGHAGDEESMRAGVALALRHGVAVGAHPGFEDREHFGRRALPATPAQAASLVRRQVEALQRVAAIAGAAVRHVKLHGALYNLAAADRALAEAVIGAVMEIDAGLVLFVPAGSEMERVARGRRGLAVAAEVFADRTYQADGSLTPRSSPSAVIEDEAAAAAQVLRLVQEGRVRTAAGTDLALAAATVCIHGDGPHAVAFARRLGRALRDAGVELRAPGARGIR